MPSGENEIGQTLAFVSQQQQPNGSFLAQSSADQTAFSDPLTYTSPFFTSLICAVLAPHRTHPKHGKTITAITHDATDYLRTQQGEQWSFNYWDRNSKQARQQPYPDDLDDTFAALIALQAAQPEAIDGSALAAITKLLTTLEVAPGGPYRTWLVPLTAKKVWLDTDVAVNAQVATFLHRLGLAMPKITDYLNDKLASETLASPYYPAPFPLYYYLSQSYPTIRGQLASHIKKALTSSPPTNQLDLALTILALNNCAGDRDLLEELRAKLSSSFSSGKWTPQAYCYDPARDKQQFYAGASALTAAFAAAALLCTVAPIATTPNPEKTVAQRGLRKRVARLYEERVRLCPAPFRRQLLEARDRLLVFDDTHAITTLPQLFYISLIRNVTKKIDQSQELLAQLGLANLYGWIAYTYIDDVIDGERDSSVLPIANFALKQSVLTFAQAPGPAADFMSQLNATFDAIDAANGWEIQHCLLGAFKPADLPTIRLTSYPESHYTNRSLGHALAPLAILSAAGYRQDSPEVASWLEFFHHYLAARQLNDDAHDWLTDLQEGRLNPVNIAVLKRYRRQTTSNALLRPKAFFKVLEQLFWHDELPKTSRRILKHVAQARQALARCDFLEQKDHFATLLAIPERAAQKALTQQREAKDFITTYYNEPGAK